MLKKILLVFTLLFMIPVHAGELENTWNKGGNIFLYLYTKPCKYCILFSPRYDKLTQAHKNDFTFLKYDIDTQYGNQIFNEFQGRYVPFVLMMNKSKNKIEQIGPSCLLDSYCTENKIKSFL